MLEGQINGLLSKIDEETCTEDSKLEQKIVIYKKKKIIY